MPRPRSKPELLAAASDEFDGLRRLAVSIDEAERDNPGLCDSWSLKDILAHLDAWHRMFLDWEAHGRRGEVIPMPAEGYTWTDTPALNARIQAETSGDPWEEVWERLGVSHHQVLDVIESYSDEDLFTKRRYRWTGSTSVGSYAVSATCSHYAWAAKLIRWGIRGG
jgi:hypothetical protein